MNAAEFQKLCAQGYNYIPVVRTITADLDTPLSLYLKLANQPFTYLFESVVGGERWARYSFIGLACQTILRLREKRLTVTHAGKVETDVECVDPLTWIENYLQNFRVPVIADLPLFSGGLVGYLGYDTIRYIEPRLSECRLPDPLQLPELLLMVSQALIVVDNLRAKAYLVVYAKADEEDAYAKAERQLDELIERLQHASVKNQAPVAAPNAGQTDFASNMTVEEYEAGVRRAIQYFVDGDAMQMTLSQRFSRPFHAQPLDFYRALRSLNPSPYLYYLHLDDFYIAGASPEILVRLEEDQVTIRPIAGTRPRGRTQEEDVNLEHELLADPKELAEHLMLIDLARNDVGRVCEYGTVNVTEKMGIERYSHVMHIVSQVVGRLRPGLTAMDVLRASFPAGTLTGTPKIRAMEMIDELETVKRGIYGGAVGYFAWNGSMDFAIALRTAVIKDGEIHVQAGGGLVADSVPRSEWQESVNKAKALLKAAAIAEQGL